MKISEIVVFVIYLLFMLGIGFYFFFKSKDGSEKTYFLGGRQMGAWVTALSAGASDMSAWVLMGLPTSYVRYVLDLVNFHSVDFDGSASGRALVVAPFGDFSANANLTVDDFLFEHGRMGVLSAAVNWNKEESQIDIDAIANDGPDARTIIYGYVSPKRN